MEGHQKFLGGGVVLKVKLLEAKYEAKLEFLGGRGCTKQKKTYRGVWIFSGTTHSVIHLQLAVGLPDFQSF